MNVHEYGAGGTRRGRRISGSKKPTNGDMIADARFSEASSVNTNGLRSNEATFALIQVVIVNLLLMTSCGVY